QERRSVAAAGCVAAPASGALALGQGSRRPRRQRARRSAGAGWRRDGAVENVAGGLIVSSSLRGAKRRSNPSSALLRYGLLRGACHRAALRADPLARNDELLQLSQQRIAAGDLDLAGRRLEIELLDHAVVHQHRVAMGADAEAVAGGVELHAVRLG